MPITPITWKKRPRRYAKSGITYERLESTDGTYTVGTATTDLEGDESSRYYAITRIGRQERILSVHRKKSAAFKSCERHARTH